MSDALDTTTPVDVRPWPHDTSIAHLVLLDISSVPGPDEIDRWVDDLLAHGRRPDGSPLVAPPAGACDATTSQNPTNGASTRVEAIRTGALFPDAAEMFAERGFVPIDHLVLLERTIPVTDALPRSIPPAGVRLRRLRRRHLGVAAELDAACFDLGWRNDAASLTEIQGATPRSLARLALLDRRPVGMALTGKAGTTGYLQRFAVLADARRRGLARLLVDDSLRWLQRHGATNALVNTGVDNAAALSLYDAAGFRRRTDRLVVMERRR